MQQKLTIESKTPTRENIEDTDYAPNTSVIAQKALQNSQISRSSNCDKDR